MQPIKLESIFSETAKVGYNNYFFPEKFSKFLGLSHRLNVRIYLKVSYVKKIIFVLLFLVPFSKVVLF